MPGEGRGEGRSLTPKEASKLKILDPACGSGSFLIGAYQHLLDWHLQWYVSDGADKWSKGKTATLRPADRPSMAALIQTEEAGAIPNPAAGHWALTIKERKRILLDNIHGVDIDYQAVEVTKLALLLKVLEGETMESLGGLWTLFRERALPDLGHNIQCGNSLIGTDIMATDAWRQMSEDERDRVNPFDFEAAFPNVVAQGGFNAVIGNPPYIRMEQFVPLKEYLAATYKAHEERADLYAYFLERALNLLTKAGRVGQIVSNKFIRAKYGRPLRAVIADSSDVLTVADFAGADVFRAATVRTVVLVMSPKTRNAAPKAQYIPVPPPGIIEELRSRRTTLDHYAATRSVTLPANAFEPNEWKLTSEKNSGLLLKLRAVGVPLHKAIGGRALFGVKTGFNDAFIIDKETARRIDRQMQVTKPILFGRDIRRYSAVHTGRFVIYLHPNRRLDDFPGVKRHVIE